MRVESPYFHQKYRICDRLFNSESLVGRSEYFHESCLVNVDVDVDGQNDFLF